MDGKPLTEKDRFYIEKRIASNITPAQIARELGVHRSTIGREIKRNTAQDFNGLYSWRRADSFAKTRRSLVARDKAFSQLTEEIKAKIHERLTVHTSPDVISGEM